MTTTLSVTKAKAALQTAKEQHGHSSSEAREAKKALQEARKAQAAVAWRL